MKLELKDFRGYYVTSEGDVIGKRGHVLKGKVTWDGYREVVLSDGLRRRSARVHTLIMENFVGERPEGHVVNHKDSNKLNNSLDNLEYVTFGENTRHSFLSGTSTCKGRPVSSLSREEFQKIKQLRDEGWEYRPIRDLLGLSCRPDYLGEILTGRKCSQVSGFG